MVAYGAVCLCADECAIEEASCSLDLFTTAEVEGCLSMEEAKSLAGEGRVCDGCPFIARLTDCKRVSKDRSAQSAWHG
jgi:hypothetical protein